MDNQEVQIQDRLRSLNSDNPTHVEFINKTRKFVEVWWVDFSGMPVSYGYIGPENSLLMDTYLTHPWLFRASRNGAKLLGNLKEVYMPTPPEYDDNGSPEYLSVAITSPVYSLQESCLMLLRMLVKEEDYGRLDIPVFLRQHLRRPPDLLKELEQLRHAIN